MTPRRLRWLMNLWPPFLAAGIRVLEIDADFSYARVRLRRHWFNRNYFGTHFGGSLYAMTDPFFALLIVEGLGRDYLVWDKAAEIDFVAATREDVYAEFRVDASLLEELRAAAANGGKVLRWLETEVRTASGGVVARVRKQVYVRRKRGPGPAA
jgi:acyl-coenzyme A thioesterase PaaI-like protein